MGMPYQCFHAAALSSLDLPNGSIITVGGSLGAGSRFINKFNDIIHTVFPVCVGCAALKTQALAIKEVTKE